MEAHEDLGVEQMLALGGGDEQVVGRRLTPHQPLPSAQLPERKHLRQRSMGGRDQRAGGVSITAAAAAGAGRNREANSQLRRCDLTVARSINSSRLFFLTPLQTHGGFGLAREYRMELLFAAERGG